MDLDDMLCVPRQIAGILSLDFGMVCEELQEIERILYGKEDMMQKGCTPRMVIEFARSGS